MTERQKERLSNIGSLVGSIESTGESNQDAKVLENMDFAEEVLLYLVDTLVRSAEYSGHEESKLKIAEKSKLILENIKETVDSQKESNKRPRCYKAESNSPYALCIGNGKERCNHCVLYTDLLSPYDLD